MLADGLARTGRCGCRRKHQPPVSSLHARSAATVAASWGPLCRALRPRHALAARRRQLMAAPSSTVAPAPDENAEASAAHEASRTARDTKRQLRGSTLLLSGRFVSLGVNFVTQVLIA